MSEFSQIDNQLREVLMNFPCISLAVLFGSVAAGQPRSDSDLDIAVAADHPLTLAEKMAMIQALAEKTGRPIDLIDLATVSEPLLGQIVQHGRRLLGSDTLYGNLINRHLIEHADFMPYRNRVLAERRMTWIGK
jgi:predicted nucleotidyltransferase